MKSLVSIIIPTFNRAHLIKDTLNNILTQNYANWECFIIDDCSTDNSVEVINDFIKVDSRFNLIIRPENKIKGASSCRNIGLKNATGDFIQFLDSDDIISSNKISEQINLIENCKGNVIATCKWGRFKYNSKDSSVFENLAVYNFFDNPLLFLDALAVSKGYFPINAYLIKTDLIKNGGLWNEYLSINDDCEFMMRVIANTDKIYFAPQAIAYYRWTDLNNNLSNFNNKEKVNNVINSYKLIDAYLKIRFNKESIFYIEHLKKPLFLNIENSFPELKKLHTDFFKAQIKERSFLNWILNKIKF
ncbi:glycosyltransferase family 2 protein [Yeosuana marina]|uniref:glycosyltransferase family 2 protein n=1 Tax=Yeosuana marina TaxID=1565536 RepID=UPI001420510C|nr:glycosyltransferase family 2 protein [Yeosuana marina]